jgi:biotin carboxylase
VIVDSVCVAGRTHVLGVADKDHFPLRPTARRITYPAAIGPEARRRLVELNREVVRALGLRDGFAHGEYMVDGDSVRLVEIGARGGGSGIFTHVLPHLTGIDTARLSLEFAFGSAREPDLLEEDRAANLHFFTFPAGRLRELSGLAQARSLPGVLEIMLTLKRGDVLEPPRDDAQRPGPAIVVGRTRSEGLAITRRVEELVRAELG